MPDSLIMPRRAGQPRPRRWIRLGKRIAELRSAIPMTQEELVAVIDRPDLSLSAPYLSNIERGYSQPSTRLLKALSHALDADYNELAILAGYQDEPDPGAWVPPRDLAPIFQRYQGLFSRAQLEEGERILRSVFFRGESPDEAPTDKASEECQEDEPET